MKRALILFFVLCPFFLYAQPKLATKKYQSLLWEITGNGMKKPSYLFGTMHVSSKMAFHLADSFYVGIRNADMVALETNPESWQEDMSKYQSVNESEGYNGQRLDAYIYIPEDYLSINTLRFYKYDKKIERALYSNPSTINNLLYRSYGNQSSDFEEDTYLDMYIYQCGKKWGKKVAGVENYDESMKLMAEAYRDAAKDKNKKDRSYGQEEGYSSAKLQEAYRTGNLDWLDSINKYNSFSGAFDEKFLYKRNEIQAGSIDSILKTGQSLFVGVGAAHLPGNRGVIEWLRSHGYKLRAVKMGQRDSQHKTMVEQLRVPVVFTTQKGDDDVFKVDIPGKFYKFGDEAGLEQSQYADMANGSYYMVTRIMTNAWMWGNNADKVYHNIDSILYENIPGKIINKLNITRNGYKGFDVTNRTRRGDLQRYNIFVTPFEILIFKMGGTGDYVKNGGEAKRFFESIKLNEYHTSMPLAWKKFSPAMGGFSIDMPHEPFVGNDGSWIYEAEDKTGNTQYRLIRTDIHNYRFVEEDSFDLGLMEQSFASSDFIDKLVSRKHTSFKGYPALDCQYTDKNGGIYLTRFIIQGPHYYTLLAHGKQETAKMKGFINSFEIKPYKYGESRERKDTSLYYTVKSSVFPEAKKKEQLPQYNYGSDDDDDSENDKLLNGAFRSKVISNDTTGEKIYVNFFKAQRYFYSKDSSIFDKETSMFPEDDTSWIIRTKKRYELPGNVKVWETILSDTGSSRTLWGKNFYKDGIGFSLLTESDTLTGPSDFVRSFFETFSPADTLKGTEPFAKKTNLFFEDFLSNDSVAHKRALKSIYSVRLDSTDFHSLTVLINGLTWKEKKYLDTKKLLIGKLDGIRTKEASNYLKDLYYAAGDTVELQYAALEILLQQQTQYSFSLFRDIVIAEPPVLNVEINGGYKFTPYNSYNIYSKSKSRYSYDNGNFMDELFDSLKLTRTILPDLLPLLNLDDYKQNMMGILGRMVDSNLIVPKDYEIYFAKFLIEARQELKKQSIAEKKKAIAAAEEKKEGKDDLDLSINSEDEEDKDYGNDDLALYATLLIPNWEMNTAVPSLVKQMLSSSDKRLKYNLLLLLMRNKRSFPDTLLSYFAKMDEYRYELYTDLGSIGMADKFPARYNTHLDLGKSKLLASATYSRPDSVIYIDRLAAEVKGKKGFVYFYKYKGKKDDPSWKLASVGLVPEDPKLFQFDGDEIDSADDASWDRSGGINFTSFSKLKIKEDEPIQDQLNKQLKKLLYSTHKSAKQFYLADSSESIDDLISVTGYRE